MKRQTRKTVRPTSTKEVRKQKEVLQKEKPPKEEEAQPKEETPKKKKAMMSAPAKNADLKTQPQGRRKTRVSKHGSTPTLKKATDCRPLTSLSAGSALREIRQQQRSTKPLLPVAPFRRLVAQTTRDVAAERRGRAVRETRAGPPVTVGGARNGSARRQTGSGSSTGATSKPSLKMENRASLRSTWGSHPVDGGCLRLRHAWGVSSLDWPWTAQPHSVPTFVPATWQLRRVLTSGSQGCSLRVVPQSLRLGANRAHERQCHFRSKVRPGVKVALHNAHSASERGHLRRVLTSEAMAIYSERCLLHRYGHLRDSSSAPMEPSAAIPFQTQCNNWRESCAARRSQRFYSYYP